MKLSLMRIPVALRTGLLVRLEDEAGHSGVGEASPLPGYSPDNLASAEAALRAIDPRALEAGASTEPSDARATLRRASALLPSGEPAARFALETALLDLLCARAERSPFELFGVTPLAKLPVNALLDAKASDPLLEARRLCARGFETVKVKLAPAPERATELLETLARESSLRLRADANRCLGRGGLERLLPRLAELELEFLEEPCPAPLWPELPGARPRLALDESLQGANLETVRDLLARSGARVLILKPMALGGFTHCFELAELARSGGVEVVVTHLFDGALAHRAASLLALLVQSGCLAAGLAAHAGLADAPARALALGADGQLDAGTFREGVSSPSLRTRADG